MAFLSSTLVNIAVVSTSVRMVANRAKIGSVERCDGKLTARFLARKV